MQAKLHQGVVQRQDLFGTGEIGGHLLGGGGKLFALPLLPHVGFYHPHPLDIFLHGVVQIIVFTEHLAEDGHSLTGDHQQAKAQNGHYHRKDPGHFAPHIKGHHKGKDQHKGGAEGGAHQHHIGHLHVGHVGGQPGDQAGGGKFVDVAKGKPLDIIKQVLTQVFGKATGGGGTKMAGQAAAG